jgi:DNA polymerase elongation subunit (family B)
MNELDKLLQSIKVDDLLTMDFSSLEYEEKDYLLKKVTEIADDKCYEVGIEYSIRDVELIDKLDDKLKLIELALTLAYDSKTNYDDVFAQIRMWDAIIYNHLRVQNFVLPPITKHGKDSAYVGAYVKDPIIGLHKWIASFDLNSLYPSLIQQYNISPGAHMTKSLIQNRIDELEGVIKNTK